MSVILYDAKRNIEIRFEDGKIALYRNGEFMSDAPLPDFDEQGNIMNPEADGSAALIFLSQLDSIQ